MSTTHKTSRRRSLMKAFLATSTSWKGTGNIILLKLNISGLLGVASHGLTLIHIHPNLNVDCYIQKLVFHSFQKCAGILGIFSVLDISTCRCASPLISKFTDSDAKRALDSTMFFFFNTHGLRFCLWLLLWLLWLLLSPIACRLNATDSYESSGKYKGQRTSGMGREASGSFMGGMMFTVWW